MADALLELKDVHKSFGHIDVIKGVSLSVHKGEHMVIFGPSGGGKSTLLRVLAGLYDPQRVEYEVDGEAAAGVRHLGSVSTLIPQETKSSRRRCARTSRSARRTRTT